MDAEVHHAAARDDVRRAVEHLDLRALDGLDPYGIGDDKLVRLIAELDAERASGDLEAAFEIRKQ